MNEEQQTIKKSKKFAVGDLPPSPTTSTGTTSNNKRPVRHHVKRRSSGRVHVSKLAPMARAQQDNEDGNKKPMKRSQSNKSLNRLSSLERKSTMTAFTPAPKEKVEEEEQPNSPPTTPPLVNNTIDTTKKPAFSVSSTIPAAPIEQPLNATADDLLVTPVDKKSHLKSQFVVNNKSIASSAAAVVASGNMTRTQQKLLLQRQQSFVHDENNIAHPKNMIRLTREMEKMGKEYRCVRKYQDPMMESLVRCQEKQQMSNNKRLTMPIQRTFSTNIIPTTTAIPHMEQRRQILLKTALLQQQQQQQQHFQGVEDDSNNNKWSATHLLERLFYGTS